jgi:hypothetical protein
MSTGSPLPAPGFSVLSLKGNKIALKGNKIALKGNLNAQGAAVNGLSTPP